jgi:adenylate cyclase class 1
MSLTSLSEIGVERNSAAQHRNNQARIAALRRDSSAGFVRVFDQVPPAIDVNDPQVVGYVPDPETPHGLRGCGRQLWRPRADLVPAPVPAARPVVEGLYLIGSPGTVIYNPASDLDWWLCFEDGAFAPRGFELFQRKLLGLKEWASRECGVETNFYCVNLADLAQGRITHLADAATDGEVAPQLLLEEFYRTFILVAGRMPLWPVLPLDVDAEGYGQAALLARESEFLDLGFPALPKPPQILAEALWLTHKSEADPLKGLVKMTILLEYVENDFHCPPLCAQVKEAVLQATDLLVDPYVLTIERVINFGQTSLTPVQLELVRAAVVLKVLGVATDQPDLGPRSAHKRRFLEERLDLWGWPPERLEHFAAYGLWTEWERLELSREILQTLVRLYVRIAGHLTSRYPSEVDFQGSRELAPFAARLLTRQAGLEATLETLPAKRHHRALEGRLVLRPAPDAPGWTLHALATGDGAPGPDNIIYAGGRAARVAAWLIHNQFDHIGNLKILPAPDGQVVELDDLPGLFDEIAAFFPPVDLGHEEAVWAARPQGLVLLVLNFEERLVQDDDIIAVDIISRTGWGEMRHEYLGLGHLDKRADRYLQIARAVIKGGEIEPGNLVFHARHFSPHGHQAVVNIRGALAATLKRQPDSPDNERARRMDL